MTIKDAYKAVEILAKNKFNNSSLKQIITPFFFGKPGIGKTETVFKLAEDLKAYLTEQGKTVKDVTVLDIRMSQHDSTDIKGIPKANDVVSKWLPPEFMPIEGSKHDVEGNYVILFFDEFNRAGHDELQALFEVVYDFKIGGKPLMKNCFVVCAGNRGFDDNTTVTEMDSALRDRFVFLDIDDVKLKDWVEWAETHGVRSEVISYLQSGNGEKLYIQEEEYSITPRSWFQFSELLKLSENLEWGVKTYGPGKIYSLTGDFLRFLKEYRITGQQVLEDYDKIADKLNESERADIHNICQDIVSTVKAMGKSKKKYTTKIITNFDKFWINNLVDDNRVYLAKELKEADVKFIEAYVKFKPEFLDVRSELFGSIMVRALGLGDIDLNVLHKIDPKKEIEEAIEQEKQKKAEEAKK